MGDTGAAVTERHDCLSAGARVARAAVVYRFFDADDTLLYIGVTSDFPLRLEQHKRQSAFGPSIDSYTLAYYTTRAAADHAERAAILDECPAGNSRVRVKRKMPPGPVPQPLATTRKLVCIRLELDRDTYRHRSVSETLEAIVRQEQTMSAEYYTVSDERVTEIVAADPSLTTEQVRSIATADWDEGGEHQSWLDTAPATEVAGWVAAIAAARDDAE